MEIAQDVRELLVGSTTEQQLLQDMQTYHRKYCEFMTNLATQVSELSLAMCPESRIFYYQLQCAMYKDWTAAITDCAFMSSTCNTKTLESKLNTYEQVVARILRNDSESSSSPVVDVSKDSSMEQWIHMYEAHRKKIASSQG
ncbi:hypothetical protein DYB37_004522 [Aphanomyces astaci]|uniref:Uncharacterized protein n=1 Tax=Aphanomyces astaci TaxID=112090 RepID=A0A397B2Z4_APHAT|nr:hypothetical protein AaE_006410 [Aphanomyces astaci]RHY01023.1 hypothetical protein DYB36_006265 [Aphanomyces astaci]RHY13474.1 hypothetical protein DYB25_003694 [Aphanomyces astaci]RHY37636.1 hypothetical protein DYB38_002914 [Aphanomyces astaci]RHY38605.1 hypothetical protein DYB34_004691 [Aphanomyces astaci]